MYTMQLLCGNKCFKCLILGFEMSQDRIHHHLAIFAERLILTVLYIPKIATYVYDIILLLYHFLLLLLFLYYYSMLYTTTLLLYYYYYFTTIVLYLLSKHRRIVSTITLLARRLGCYKIGLDCRDVMKTFYSSLGYGSEAGNANTMTIRFPTTSTQEDSIEATTT